jgi:hypothetical protein
MPKILKSGGLAESSVSLGKQVCGQSSARRLGFVQGASLVLGRLALAIVGKHACGYGMLSIGTSYGRLSRSSWKFVAAVGCDGYMVRAVRVSSSVGV